MFRVRMPIQQGVVQTRVIKMGNLEKLGQDVNEILRQLYKDGARILDVSYREASSSHDFFAYVVFERLESEEQADTE